MRRAVAITGLGAVTPLGLDFASSMAALLAGQSGVRAAPAPILASAPTAIAASVPEGFAACIAPAEAGYDRVTLLGLAAAREAVANAGLAPDDAQCERIGVFTGIGMGGLLTLETTMRDVEAKKAQRGPNGPILVHPFTVPRMMPNALCAWLAIELGLHGPTQSYSVACASSAVALGEAMRCIAHGYADAIVVIGAEALLSPGSYAAWQALRVLATPDAEDPARSHKAFDLKRSGFVLGEGSAALVLEAEDFARRRGARMHARLAGYGNSTDAQHITKPSRPGQAAAMRAALRDAGLPADAVGYVNAHGTATPLGDLVESQAIHDAFGAHASHLAVSATKSMHGHLIGAGGALEFAISVHALASGSIPPTANLSEQDPGCALDVVPGSARHGQRLDAVMSNSFAFGGSNVSLIATRADA